MAVESTEWNRRLNIALAFDVDFSHGMGIYEGVREYAQRRGNWNLIPLNAGFESTLLGLVQSGKIDGIVGSFISDSWLSTLGRRTLAVVNVSQLSSVKTVSSVGVNYEEVGRRVGERFLSNGGASYGFLGVGGQFSSQQLLKGLTECLTSRGEEVHVSRHANESHWASWLDALPKPTSVLTTHDSLARRMVGICRREGWTVPGDIAVVGVGDVAIESIYAGIGLSTVSLPGVEIGRRAAAELERQLQGATDVVQVNVSTGPIIERDSSLRGRKVDVAVDKVLNYIRHNFGQPLVVDDLARMAGVSRRSLELRFKAELGSSPYQVILEQRMSHAKKLLAESEQRIYEIARACGFPTQHPFAAAFKKYVGVSPRQFRAGASC